MPLGWLCAFIAFYAVQRAFELGLSARNVRYLRALGAVEHGAGHFPLIVLVHTLLPLALIAEVVWLGTRPPHSWPAWLALWAAAQVLRYSAIRALGRRWNVRIWIVPSMPLVRSGPYRLLKHPNYVAVVFELIAAPLMFGAWRTAALVTVLNALALTVRIRAEDRALDSVPSTSR